MPELNGWGPLIALWIGGGIHLMWIVWRDNQRTPRQRPVSDVPVRRADGVPMDEPAVPVHD